MIPGQALLRLRAGGRLSLVDCCGWSWRGLRSLLRTRRSFLLITGIALQACHEYATSPKVPPTSKAPTSLKPRSVSPDMKSLPVSAVDLPATQGSSVTVASYPFSEGIIVDINIEGLINLESDSRARPINYSGGLDYRGPTSRARLAAIYGLTSLSRVFPGQQARSAGLTTA